MGLGRVCLHVVQHSRQLSRHAQRRALPSVMESVSIFRPLLVTFATSGSISVLVWWIAIRTHKTTGKILQPFQCCVFAIFRNLSLFKASCILYTLMSFTSHSEQGLWSLPTLPTQLLTPHNGCFIRRDFIKCWKRFYFCSKLLIDKFLWL